LPSKILLLAKYFSFLRLYQKLIANISSLLDNSSGFRGYLLGLILGFLPCGMLYGAFAISGNFSSPILAFAGMALFAFATFFALFSVGFMAKLSFKLPEFKIIANIIIVINIMMLFKMFLKNLN
ncbi:MAG: sulfite exporter TauE/SafE family protein, partial [Alphaproteobacteria bacterium]